MRVGGRSWAAAAAVSSPATQRTLPAPHCMDKDHNKHTYTHTHIYRQTDTQTHTHTHTHTHTQTHTHTHTHITDDRHTTHTDRHQPTSAYVVTAETGATRSGRGNRSAAAPRAQRRPMRHLTSCLLAAQKRADPPTRCKGVCGGKRQMKTR